MTEMEDTMINIHEVLETNDMIEKEIWMCVQLRWALACLVAAITIWIV